MTTRQLIRDNRPMVFFIFPVTALFLFVLAYASAVAQVVPITVPLSGTQEVPPVASPATGTGTLSVDTVSGAVSGTVTFSGLTSPLTAGHVHMAAAGINGPVIIPLVGGVGTTAGTMRVPPGVVLLPNQLAAFRADGLYLNLHTSINPGGEIRGQILFSSVWDEVSLEQLVTGNFDPMQEGTELAALSGDGTIFVSLDLVTWIKLSGTFTKLLVGDFNGDGADDLGGFDKETGTVRITTDLGATWMEIVPPQK